LTLVETAPGIEIPGAFSSRSITIRSAPFFTYFFDLYEKKQDLQEKEGLFRLSEKQNSCIIHSIISES
jgi:hypothetical protein